MAFEDFVGSATYYRYTYNAANELQSAIGYRGSNPTATTSPLPGRGFGFTYDEAGNRKTASVSGDSASYWPGTTPGTAGNEGANSLNQPRSRGTLKTRVSGTSHKDATVTVTAGGSGATALRETPADRYWDHALPNYAQYATVSLSAALAGYTMQTGSVLALTRPATEVLTYDDDGNLTDDGLWHYSWDAENRLATMSTSAAVAAWGAPLKTLTFTYDYRGRRVRKQSNVATPTGTVTTDRTFIYHGWSLIAELDTASNKVVRSYAWGLDIDSSLGGTGGVGGLVLQTLHTDTTLTAYHLCYDGNGNVTALVNRGTNQIAASYEYGPFGENVRTQTLDAALVAQGQPFRFSTKYTDAESGLVYYGHRYYDPSMGRFINRDPIGEAGGNNLYGFVGNSPVNGIDLMGHESVWYKPWTWWESRGDSNGERLDLVQPPPNNDFHEGDDISTGSSTDRSAPRSANPSDTVGANYNRTEALTGAPNSADDYFDIYADAVIAASADYRLAQSTPTGRARARTPSPQEIELQLMRAVSEAGRGGRNDSVAYERAQRALETFRINNGIRPPGVPRDLEIRAAGSPPRSAARSGDERVVFDSVAGRYRDAKTGRFVAAGDLPWPGNNGFITSAPGVLQPGTVIDRFGAPSGRYAGQPGATIPERGMAPGSEGMPYRQYEVLKPLPAEIGPAAPVPAFEAPGGATQYRFNRPIEQLVSEGYLRPRG